MHRLGVAHRDIKLDNIMISQQGVLRLIDYNGAVAMPAQPPPGPNFDNKGHGRARRAAWRPRCSAGEGGDSSKPRVEPRLCSSHVCRRFPHSGSERQWVPARAGAQQMA